VLIEEYFGAEGVIQCTDRQIQTRGFYHHAL
jgi:hypothetical protein